MGLHGPKLRSNMSTFLVGAAKQLTGNTLRAKVSLNRVSRVYLRRCLRRPTTADVPGLVWEYLGNTGRRREEKGKARDRKERPGTVRNSNTDGLHYARGSQGCMRLSTEG